MKMKTPETPETRLGSVTKEIPNRDFQLNYIRSGIRELPLMLVLLALSSGCEKDVQGGALYFSTSSSLANPNHESNPAEPKPEPESDFFLKYVSFDGDDIKVPNGEWEDDGTPEEYITVSKEEFGLIQVKLNIQILTTKIGVYENTIKHLSNEVKRLKELREKLATDYKNREHTRDVVKWMWQSYEIRFRNKTDTPIAKSYREKIFALQRTISASANQSEVKDRLVSYDILQVENAASTKASGKTTDKVKPNVTEWSGDVSDLIRIYEAAIGTLQSTYINPAKARLEQNRQALSKNLR